MFQAHDTQDEAKNNEWLILQERLAAFFIAIPTRCPYGLPFKAVYHQGRLGRLPDPILGQFLAAGYRRNGNCLYQMICPECRACVPIRLRPADFQPNRNQRRVLRKNQQVSATVGQVVITEEKLALCDRFLAARYPGKGTNALDYYGNFFSNALCTTMEIQYRIADRLLGVAIVDVSEGWLNAVYFYFDPDESARSPGIYNILFLIDFCRRQDIGLLYLGYWIETVPAMAYKADFKPHALLSDGRWTPVERRSRMQRQVQR